MNYVVEQKFHPGHNSSMIVCICVSLTDKNKVHVVAPMLYGLLKIQSITLFE